MNTVKVGDSFENKSYRAITRAIENDDLGINKNFFKIFQKKGYYSKDREKDIIFDLSIEIWPPNAQRFSLLFLIECKSSNSKKVPVDDVEEFVSKIQQVAGANVKGIMMTDNSFQSGSLKYAENKGLMLIEVESEEKHQIILHKTQREYLGTFEEEIENKITRLCCRILATLKSDFNGILGLKMYSAKEIEEIGYNIISKFIEPPTMKPILELIPLLEKEYGLSFCFDNYLLSVNNKELLGYYDISNKTIHISRSIAFTNKMPFVLGHELGHFFLHSNLQIYQEIYNNFEDSEYDLFHGKHELKNDKNWIEWQANKFSNAFFLSKDLFLYHFATFRRNILGIGKYHRIFLDSQPINQTDYYKTIKYLAEYFNTTKISVMYRIEDLDLIIYGEGGKNDLQSLIRRVLFE